MLPCCHSHGSVCLSPTPSKQQQQRRRAYSCKNPASAVLKCRTRCMRYEFSSDGSFCKRFPILMRSDEEMNIRKAVFDINQNAGKEMEDDEGLYNPLQSKEAATPEKENPEISRNSSALKICEKNQEKLISKSKLKALQKQQKERERLALIEQSFSSFYESQYGGRWPTLLLSLLSEPRSSCLWNVFSDTQLLSETITRLTDPTRVPFLKLPVYESTDRFPHPERDSQNLLSYYLLDASVLVAEALDVQKGDWILDLCAAPGGKTLAILQQLGFRQGFLTANEPCADRRRRLWKVIIDYVPKNLRQCVRITGRDGIRWNDYEVFDKENAFIEGKTKIL